MATAPAAALPEGWPVVSVEKATEMLVSKDSPFELVTERVNGVEMQVYKNAPPDLRTHLIAGSETFDDRVMLVYDDERVTFDANYRAVAHLSNHLINTLGLRRGDRVAISMRNYPQWSVAFFACVVSGLIATPLNSWWTGEELEYGLSDSGARVAIVDDQILSRILPHRKNLPSLETIIVARQESPAAEGIVSMESIIGDAKGWAELEKIDLPDVELHPDDDVTIMYSSGTTGRPKGILATHRGIMSNMMNSVACQIRALFRRGEMPPEPDPTEPQKATLLAIPFFHATGSFAILVPSLLTGSKIVSMYKWDAGEALPLIERERVTVFGGVPAIAWQVLEHPDRDKYDLSSVEAVSYGGAPSAPELVSTIKRKFSEATPANGWGMTETCATATLNLAEDYVNRPDSAGLPGPAMKLKVVDPDGNTLGPNEIGELWCFGPANAKLYWNRPDATAETFKDGWVVTGDLAKLDEEGFVYLVDRAKDMLIRGGENIYCIEVENAIYDHGDVMDAAVVGIPHKVLGEEVGAVVQLKPGSKLTQADLQIFLADHLAGFKIPVRIDFEDQPLPRNANGKILKAELRERFKEAV